VKIYVKFILQLLYITVMVDLSVI